MIVKAKRLLGLTKNEVENIVSQCRNSDEMFMVMFDHTDLKDGYHEYRGLDTLNMNDNSFSVVCIADMVAYRDENGDYHEIKNRQYAHGRLKLETHAVLRG